ncbi:DUF6090 family protein [Croceivirga thetidis]|uniref:Uncharacterized protein n=1 Tax=Croceivirga thetidis TaxID=2721623 RepID=A0ABX1GM26_9FLAO|nr:DUF6090 family protein [Croceivirga thetidis]NKI30924.1 hypothetical protein [Croceivirga thetidis]
MIKFFRLIRKKLLSENQFSKYLIYALGEIVLVVIGILIALQINNSNELHKAEVKEQQYLTQLLNDFETNKKVLEFYKKEYDRQLKFLDVIVRHTGPKVKSPNSEVFDSIQKLNTPSVNVLYATSASQSNLDLGLLTNNHLKQFIQALPVVFSLYRGNENAITNLLLKQREIQQQYIPLMLLNSMEPTQENFKADTLGLLRNMQFQNVTVDRLWVTESAIFDLDRVQKHNDSIISLIRNELKMSQDD